MRVCVWLSEQANYALSSINICMRICIDLQLSRSLLLPLARALTVQWKLLLQFPAAAAATPLSLPLRRHGNPGARLATTPVRTTHTHAAAPNTNYANHIKVVEKNTNPNLQSPVAFCQLNPLHTNRHTHNRIMFECVYAVCAKETNSNNNNNRTTNHT